MYNSIKTLLNTSFELKIKSITPVSNLGRLELAEILCSDYLGDFLLEGGLEGSEYIITTSTNERIFFICAWNNFETCSNNYSDFSTIYGWLEFNGVYSLLNDVLGCSVSDSGDVVFTNHSYGTVVIGDNQMPLRELKKIISNGYVDPLIKTFNLKSPNSPYFNTELYKSKIRDNQDKNFERKWLEMGEYQFVKTFFSDELNLLEWDNPNRLVLTDYKQKFKKLYVELYPDTTYHQSLLNGISRSSNLINWSKLLDSINTKELLKILGRSVDKLSNDLFILTQSPISC